MNIILQIKNRPRLLVEKLDPYHIVNLKNAKPLTYFADNICDYVSGLELF